MAKGAEFADFAIAIHQRLVGTLTLHCGDPLVAEELAQDTLVRVQERWGRVAAVGDPAAYTIRIGVNLANSWFRRRAAERRAVQRLAARGRVPDASLRPGGNDGGHVRQAVAKLPPRQREVVVRRFFLDQSVLQVAMAMGISEGTVASASHRGIATLRQDLDFSLADEEVRNDA